MKILLLCTDAYGGHGGIALFNRELLSALAELPECEQIVVIPRSGHVPMEDNPDDLELARDTLDPGVAARADAEPDGGRCAAVGRTAVGRTDSSSPEMSG